MSNNIGDRNDTLLLFDIDGTLTESMRPISDEMREVLEQVRKKYSVGVVGGSDTKKQIGQLGEKFLEEYDYVFSENGLVAYEKGKLIGKQSISSYLGEENLKRVINCTLRILADIDIPIKRGTFIEFRNGMLNVSPIGRNCSQEERNAFDEYDKKHQVRVKMVERLKKELADLDLRFVIGGQISIDVFPRGWDKTYCLQFVEKKFKYIHFFGDKTYEGGNDYEIFIDKRVTGHSVKDYHETIKILKSLFLKE